MLEEKIAELTEAVKALTAVMSGRAVPVSDPDRAQPDTKEEEPRADGPAFTETELKDVVLAASRNGHADDIRDYLTGQGVKRIQQLNAVQQADLFDLASGWAK